MSEYDSGKAAEQQAAAIREKRESRLAGEAAMAAFLAEGGKIQKIANNVSGRVEGASYSAWGKPKRRLLPRNSTARQITARTGTNNH